MTQQQHPSETASRRQLLIGTAGIAAAGLGGAQAAAASPAAAGRASVQAAKLRRDSSNLLTLKDGNTLFYKDWGSGTPVVFSHGWPLSADAWNAQMVFLAEHGFRVIAHDRRGHGRSSQSFLGNDMDTYADDLAALMDALDLKGAVNVGHSTGGGEVARYIARHGARRVAKAVLVSAVPPWMARSAGNPEGIPMEVFEGLRAGVRADHSQLYRDLSAPFFGTNRPNAKPYAGLRDAFWLQGMAGSHKSLLDCIKAFSETDFTTDLKKLEVPTLLVHGDDDQIVPIDVASRRSVTLIRNAQLKEYTGAPHGLPLTHANQLNADLLAFIQG